MKKIGKLIFAALAIAFVWTAVGPQSASAADAPANLTVTSGQEVLYSYNEFGSTTQITVQRGGKLFVCTGTTGYATIGANITFSSTGSGADPTIRVEPCLGADGAAISSRGGTFTGAITLETDGSITAYSSTLRVNGTLVPNGHNLAVVTTSGAKVLGTGRVGSIALESGTAIAPGTSPGILTTGDLTLVSGATYEFELGGTAVGTEYDQINVLGSVNLGSGTLDVILYGGFKPTVGQKFTIINNDGSDAVTGIFTGLAEGASFTDEEVTYRISYVGGDGNDVVLTVLAGSPDTGFGLIKSNPVVTGGIMIIAALAITIIARKHGKVSARR